VKQRFKTKYSIKKGDQVVVIAGDDKDMNTPRTVLAVLTDDTSARIKVEGVILLQSILSRTLKIHKVLS